SRSAIRHKMPGFSPGISEQHVPRHKYQGTASAVPPFAIKSVGFSPCMAIPQRHSERQDQFQEQRTFFVTTSTAARRRFFQVDHHAELFLKVLYGISRFCSLSTS